MEGRDYEKENGGGERERDRDTNCWMLEKLNLILLRIIFDF